MKHTIAAVLLALAVTGAPSLAQASATALAMRIQEQISADPALDQVVAVPEGDAVVVTGSVASAEEKAMLDEMLSGMEGELSVDNQVTVR